LCVASFEPITIATMSDAGRNGWLSLARSGSMARGSWISARSRTRAPAQP
jgi:hypothetical protein